MTPTATMAEHLRHELARSRGFVRPSRVATLAQFLERWDLPAPASAAQIHWSVEHALEQLRPPALDALRGSRGLHTALAELMEEAPAGAPLPGDFAQIIGAAREELDARGLAVRNARVRAAAAQLRKRGGRLPPVIFDGFFTLPPAESEFVEALAQRTEVTLTLPGPRALTGFTHRAMAAGRRGPARAGFSAATPEREAEEIARRILEQAARGRRFREMGIVLRSREPYAALLETTLARFGIPYRSYFADPLLSHPAVAFLAGVVRAALGNWDHAELLSLLRMPVSGMGATSAGDRLDFELRAKLPGRGPLPQIEWRPTDGLAALRRLLPPPRIPDSAADRDQIYAWRSAAAALRGFDEAVQRAAEYSGGGENIPLARLWPRIETALATEPLRIEDRRRDAVAILDVFEARQWELPVVFVCGLMERGFPQYHREDPLLGDQVRARLGLSTAAQRQREERLLFEVAVTRATEQVVLSYPRFTEKGEETLPSFFLAGAAAAACDGRVRPAASRTVEPAAPAPICETARIHHETLSPSGIESFLQCPFQFFASRTLKLRTRPPAPRDRLTPRVQGDIIHRALAEWIREPLPGAEALNRVFQETCRELRIPHGYRTEAVRLELLRSFEAFLAEAEPRLGWTVLTEKEFEFALNPGLKIHGRIDRLEISPSNEALVIDYKYSSADKLKRRVEESEEGNLVQGGLYLLAAERAFHLKPAGMRYCGLKKEVSWVGWPLGTPPEELRGRMDAAARRAAEAHEAILAGRVEAHPADPKKCDWCDYRDACRVETIAAEIGAGAA